LKRKYVIALTVPAAAAVLLAGYSVLRSRKPINVLLITLDTTRADRLGCFGYHAALTPQLDRLSAGGVRFEQAYSSAPLTCPSHSTILTGLQPPQHGVRLNGASKLKRDVPTLATRLRAEGYQTGAFIAAFVLDSRFGLDKGFDAYDDDMTGAYRDTAGEELMRYRPGERVTDDALAWLEKRGDSPFFCWVHLYDPHQPYHAHAELGDTHLAGQSSYDAEVAYMDIQVGRLLTFLDLHDLREKTLVIAVGDHGEGLGDHEEQTHGYMLYDSTLRVPLIISCPGVLPNGRRVGDLVPVADLMPTVLDVVGASLSAGDTDRSFKRALLGKLFDPRPVYAETESPAEFGWASQQALITEKWKYIRTPCEELYERQADPLEHRNVAEMHPDVVQWMDWALATIEDGMPPSESEVVRLSEAEQQHLAALGYIAPVPREMSTSQPIKDLPDMKDRLAVVNLDCVRVALLAAGRMQEAVDCCTQMARMAPESIIVQVRLANALSQAGRLEEAIEAYQRILGMQPDLISAMIDMGMALARMGKLDEAQARFEQALDLEPDNAHAHSKMGGLMIDLGRLEDAGSQLTEAIRLDPQLPEAQYNMGRLCTLKKQYSQASSHYQQALLLQPDRLDALNNLAWLLATHSGLDTPEVGGAVRLAERACQLTDYQQPSVMDTLAAALASAGDFEHAVSIAERALALANSGGQTDLADQISQRLALYQARRPYRETR